MPIHIQHLVVTPLEENCYILLDDHGNSIVIDPGGEAERILQTLQKQSLKAPEFILNTHGHVDHVGANSEVRNATGARIGVHPLDAPMLGSALLCGAEWIGLPYIEHEPDFLFTEEETVGTGELRFEVFHTPGHSPGSCILLNRENRILIGGDLVFQGGVGRWDLPGGDQETLFRSIRDKFLPLEDDIVVYPGHGPATTVGTERRSNPFFGR